MDAHHHDRMEGREIRATGVRTEQEAAAVGQLRLQAVEVGAQIPPAFYRAVAEVLAYVWKASGRARPVGA